MSVFTVALVDLDRAAATLVRSVLSSVPARFRLAAGDRADIVVLSGGQTGWTERAASAVAAGARGLFIVRPGAASPDAVRDLARQAAATGVVVAVDVGFAAEQAWRTALPEVRADASKSLVLECFVTFDSASLAGGLLQQLALVRPIVGGFDGLATAHRTLDQYVVTGRSGDTQVTLCGLVCPGVAAELRLALVGRDCRWRLRIGGDGFARPSDITRFDSHGAHSPPPLFESPHRAAWLQLHAALTDATALAYTLDDLAEDTATASSFLY